ncbi:pyridoxamine 5'-phosphate oxidase family protein [Methanofollis ethanolicus]|uniref:pyridoxamine 5'-phosphate oxidase family protein n=1 Tax=Methanofollis ethanolicus TaxID=488124 RepID=UPI000832EFBF|nr:pyridoxamine 5'-phosphate oxidase family protein [Methanofollis ethanolicus]
MSTRLMDYFNKQPRIGVLSTASKDGKVNAGIFGSPQMIDEKTVVAVFGKNRTFANLQENPNAVFTIVEQGELGMMEGWKGVRVYMTMKEYETSGETLDAYRREIAGTAGEEAAAMIHASARFEIGEVRPLIDRGQGWEKSI